MWMMDRHQTVGTAGTAREMGTEMEMEMEMEMGTGTGMGMGMERRTTAA